MDRCALFVDAGYVLADGAMAVHGTRRGESVSWDYEGLLELLSGLARERTSLAWTRTAISFAAVGGVVLKKDVVAGLVILAAVPAVWSVGNGGGYLDHLVSANVKTQALGTLGDPYTGNPVTISPDGTAGRGATTAPQSRSRGNLNKELCRNRARWQAPNSEAK